MRQEKEEENAQTCQCVGPRTHACAALRPSRRGVVLQRTPDRQDSENLQAPEKARGPLDGGKFFLFICPLLGHLPATTCKRPIPCNFTSVTACWDICLGDALRSVDIPQCLSFTFAILTCSHHTAPSSWCWDPSLCCCLLTLINLCCSSRWSCGRG